MAKIGKPGSSICGSDATGGVSILYAALPKQRMHITLSPAVLVGMTGSAISVRYVDIIITSSTGENRDGRKEQARNAV